jgi:Restriction endonuclease
MTLPLNNLISDWGGFEKLVAKLHETGNVEVQHDVTLIGKSGAPRQIDVLVRHREGFYDHLIIVECKYWKDHVKRLHVDALITAVDDLKASRGVIFSMNGFQEGAVLAAESAAIELFQVRELTDWRQRILSRRNRKYPGTKISLDKIPCTVLEESGCHSRQKSLSGLLRRARSSWVIHPSSSLGDCVRGRYSQPALCHLTLRSASWNIGGIILSDATLPARLMNITRSKT